MKSNEDIIRQLAGNFSITEDKEWNPLENFHDAWLLVEKFQERHEFLNFQLEYASCGQWMCGIDHTYYSNPKPEVAITKRMIMFLDYGN